MNRLYSHCFHLGIIGCTFRLYLYAVLDRNPYQCRAFFVCMTGLITASLIVVGCVVSGRPADVWKRWSLNTTMWSDGPGRHRATDRNGDGPHIPASLVSCRMRETIDTPYIREHSTRDTVQTPVNIKWQLMNWSFVLFIMMITHTQHL